MTIESLIDKQDNFEIVRDKIAQILADETASQQQLATAAGKDPALWALRVFTERSNPWESYLNDSDRDEAPIVNVWYDTSTFDPSKSNVMQRQYSETVYNVDMYARGVSQSNGAGHDAGDRVAGYEAARTIRLVRNILMASEYTNLGLLGLVADRWPQSITAFQPDSDNPRVQQIVAARMAFRVRFNEFSPQVTGQPLEFVSVDIQRAADGQVIAEADYDYTT